MTNTLQHYEESDDFAKQLELWTRTYMKNASPDEVALFANVCKRTGLSPEMKQIYAVSRKDSKTGMDVFSFQTSIDGFRLIAERTGRYAPGPKATHEYNEKNELVASTAYVKKMTVDGTWHEVSETARYDEYVQEFKDKTSGKYVATQFWARMPHVMLAKCAESLALRKAFPAELSGLYTQEEMAQAHREEDKPKVEMISTLMAQEIEALLENLPKDYVDNLMEWAQIVNWGALPVAKHAAVLKSIKNQRMQIEAK